MRRKFVMLLVSTMLLAVPAIASDIDACKYLVVADFTSDPYGIAAELRRQATKRGFAVISAVSEISETEVLQTCVMGGSWSRTATGGEANLRVAYAASGALITEASAGATAWWNASSTVHALVSKIYDHLGYTGYSEEVNFRRMQREFPPRPKVPITEDLIKKTEPHSPVEGIWSDPQDEYRLGIVPAPAGITADYVAVILRSNKLLWQPGEVKAEIRKTASPDVFTCTYFLANKKPTGTPLTLDHNAVLRGSFATAKGTTDIVLVRVWPSIVGEPDHRSPTTSGATGTGFLLNRSGLIATNWHVVADRKNITVAFPGWRDSLSADVVIKDSANDLAILRLSDPSKLAATCVELPFQVSSSKTVSLGERVSAIGYPLSSILGANPKFTEGVVSSKTGLQDDPRSLQISAEVQPGSSGSPLFDGDGNIVGIVVATLDAGKLYQAANILPQNVNWAIKSDYLLDLVGMLPAQTLEGRTTAFSPEKASQCVALITAW